MTEKEYAELADLLYPNTLDTAFYFDKYKPRETKGEITRVAPSPTGYLHIGTLYQALVDKMMADKSGGSFILRLEDTDGKREIEGAGQIAYEGLVNFGLTPNEGYRGDSLDEIGDYGPYIQSKRVEIYHAFAHEIVKRGRAFPCFCEKTNGKEEILKRREEELETSNDLEVKDPCRDLTLDEIKQKLREGKTFALRLRSNGDFEKTIPFEDRILGKRDVRQNAKDDILIKSNGVPVYGFAHVVDDILMHTTTIVRGQDWYQSLPVHLEISEAFGYKPFQYAHTPNICILDEKTGNKRKISKRKDTFADVRFFLKQGYPINAVIEYLLNLLNSDFEIWRRNNPDLPYTEFPFAVKKIGVTNPMFDFAKLNDISKTIISKYTAEKVYDELLSWAKEWKTEDEKVIVENKDILTQVFSIDRGTVRPRKDITFMSEVLELYNYVLPNFKPEFNFELGVVNKEKLIKFLTAYAQNYVESVDNSSWFEDLKNKSLEHNFVDNKTYKQNPTEFAGSVSDTSKFIRIAITGRENSPELFSIMKIIGAKECVKRIENLINYLKV